MEIVTNSYMPGDPRLVEQLVYELKSQGIFDQFRKECIADVDTKPAYQNLRQRVEGSVTSFLSQQTWRPDMNKNQVREQLRKNIYESGYLDTGVERIVDQVVNPKINTIFLPQVEDVVYRYLGIEKPNRLEVKKELKIDVTDLLPTDLEAISPESDHTKDDSLNFNDSVNSESKMEEDESPPFEPIDIQRSSVQPEENSVDSHLSGFSGLQSHDSNPCTEPKICPMELSNQDSQVSQNSSESRLSIITSEDNTKMEIREDSDSKLLRSSDSNSQMENSVKMQTTFDSNSIIKDEVMVIKTVEETDSNSDSNVIDNKNMKKQEEDKEEDATKKKQIDEKQCEDKKYNERKSDEKKSRSSEKYSSKDKKDDKYRKSSSSSSRDKEKSSSKYSSSSSSKDRAKTKDRDKKESKSSSSSSKDKVEKDKAKNDKEKDRSEREKDRSEKDRNEKEKDRSEKDRSEKDKDKDRKDKSEKSKSVKDKERSGKDKDKAKSSSSNSNTSSTSKCNTNKEKDKSSSSSKSDSSKKDKEKSRSSTSSSSTSKDKSKSSHSDSKYKSSDKYKRDDKNAHDKHSSSSTSSKKDRDKKKDSKKDVKDDHYSSKDKKNDRRSTDRDSNDGRSGRQGQVNSLSQSYVSQPQKSNQESSNSNSGSGSGDSGASDQNEHLIKSKTVEHGDNKELATPCLDTQKFKYIKPKFASNFQEARKLMKIRKQLAKLERHNQLSLAQIEVPMEAPMVNGINCVEKEDISDTANDNPVENIDKVCEEPKTEEIAECKMSPKDNSLLLQSKELSKENWEALEARLAQEMSNINYNSYESPYDDYDYSGCNSVSVSPRKSPPSTREESNKVENVNKIMESESNKPKAQISKVVCIVLPQIDIRTKLEEKTISVTEEVEKNRIENAVPMATENNTKEEIEDNKCLEKEKTDTQEDVMDDKVTSNDDSKHINKMQSTENLEIDTHLTKMDVNSENKADHAENTHYSDSESIEPCIYLEPLSPRLDKNLQFLYKYIEKLEQDVKHSLRTFQNNFVPLKEKYGKRKLVENVDVKNNNKANYEQTTDLKKRRRSVAPNPNSVITKANKEKLCNSSDISPNDSFSLPLSPAESDKSNEKKEEESPKPKQKRAMTGRSMNTRNQRYSSEDLYKPRPIFMSSRRSRGAKNLE